MSVQQSRLKQLGGGMWLVPGSYIPVRLSWLSRQPGVASRPGPWQQTSGKLLGSVRVPLLLTHKLT